MLRIRGFTCFLWLGLAGCSAPPETTAESLAAQSDETADDAADDAARLGDLFSDVATVSTNGFDQGRTRGFSASLGTNGRTCNTCHIRSNAWTITPEHVRGLRRNHPIFAPFDGSDCPPTAPSQRPDSALSSELLNYALIRIQIGIPAAAGFNLASATNPKNCRFAPGSADVGGQLFMFRRPLPTTNLVFNSALMWDGRESTPPATQPITTTANFGSLGPLLFDLNHQGDAATLTHAQGRSIVGTQAQKDIVAFEMNLYTAARPDFFFPLLNFLLTDHNGRGGPGFIARTLAPNFFIGQNDPLFPGFTPASFTLFSSWEPGGADYDHIREEQRAIGRGEELFNNTVFTIHDVPGLNSARDTPLYNPADPFAGTDLKFGCAVCHNTPNIGNHSTSLPINIGVTMAQPLNNDGSANTNLDLAHLPVYTLKNATTGASVKVTDPGKALISGKWLDIGKTKGPNLRGLVARAPYFHNGSAKDLRTVVEFYNNRFAIGFTQREINDLVEFLKAL